MVTITNIRPKDMRGGLASDDSYILFMMTKPGQPSSRASPHSAYLARKDPPTPAPPLY